jgi:hypothetical protein
MNKSYVDKVRLCSYCAYVFICSSFCDAFSLTNTIQTTLMWAILIVTLACVRLFLIPARSIQNSKSAHTACEYLGMYYTSLILCREYRHFIQRRNDTQVFVYYNIMQDTLNPLIGVSP